VADLLDFLPIFQETIASIRARLDADVNAGLDPNDTAFLDTTEGGIYFDLTQTAALEIERLWDALSTEIPAAMFPAFAWGTYLDEHGITVNLVRKDQVKATGIVTFTGTVGTLIATGTQVATAQTDPDADPITFVTTASATIPAGGFVDVPVEAVLAGTISNVASGAVSVLLSPVAGIASLANAAATAGGADVESDASFRERILLEYGQPHGAGTAADYKRWAIAYAPVGFATVEPLWNGAGTVRVVVTDQSNNPVSTPVVNGLQALLDPTPGAGAGLAPIGAIVTVATPTLVTINVSATVTLLSGYTFDGAGGTVAVRTAIQDAIKAYINRLAPGDDVIREHVVSQFFTVEGVYDVSNVLLNGSATNVAISALQIARTGSVTLA
jgi:uncharacterized phage protein gp47/JayE